MATLNDSQKNLLEIALDTLTVLVALDIVWVFFFNDRLQRAR